MVALSGAALIGALILAMAGSSSADVYPGDDAFDELCREISINVTKNSIHLWELKKECKGWWSGCTYYLKVRDVLTKASICNKLTAQHNSHNAAYIDGVTISSTQCVAAMTAPKFYNAENWNEWSGKHCGTWKSTNAKGAVTMTFIDNAQWYSAQPMGIYFRQSVKFLTRKCCTAGWNASGGKVRYTLYRLYITVMYVHTAVQSVVLANGLNSYFLHHRR